MIDPALLNLLPPLRRARGDRFYGADDKHWVDLWKQDGIWLLGRRPEGAAKEWKNQVDKGLAGWAPSHWPRRLEPLVKQLLPSTVAVRVFRNADRVFNFLGEDRARVAVWRPWDDQILPPDQEAIGVLWPVLPTGPGQAVALAFSSTWAEALPEHDVTSPADAAGLVHAAAQVIRFSADPRAAAARQAAGSAFDKHLGSTNLFHRKGIWFETTVGAARYQSLFRAMLAAGFVLNPDPQAPGIIPLDLSAGEWAAWKAAAEQWVKENT